MGRSAIWIAVIGAVAAIVVATARSDAQESPDTAEPTGMPTSEPATPPPAGVEPGWEPFTPYETGPASGVWTDEHQRPADRAVIARIQSEAANRQRVNDVYAGAAAEQLEQGVAALAAHRLGLEALGEIGVVGGGQ